MIDRGLMLAIKRAITEHEIGQISPYRLSFSGLGSSGAKFGAFQADIHVSELARTRLEQVLRAGALDENTIARILSQVSRPLPDGGSLSPADSQLANNALSAPKGRALVDEMDDQLLQSLLNQLDQCIGAAAGRNIEIEPEALIYVALLVNMTGKPYALLSWLSGNIEFGVTPPAGPRVSPVDIETYLKANPFFRSHPQDLEHLRGSASVGIQALRRATVTVERRLE